MDETALTILQALRMVAEASKNYTDSTKSELNEILNNKLDKTKFFVGTYAEYQEAYTNGEIEIGAIVVITDDESNANSDSTTSELDKAILGQMILK